MPDDLLNQLDHLAMIVLTVRNRNADPVAAQDSPELALSGFAILDVGEQVRGQHQVKTSADEWQLFGVAANERARGVPLGGAQHSKGDV